LTPGGSSMREFTHKQYTEYRGRNTHNNYKGKKAITGEKNNSYKEKLGSKVGSAGRAPSLRVIPWNLPYNWGKSTEKPQLGLSKGAPISRWQLVVQYTFTHTVQRTTQWQRTERNIRENLLSKNVIVIVILCLFACSFGHPCETRQLRFVDTVTVRIMSRHDCRRQRWTTRNDWLLSCFSSFACFFIFNSWPAWGKNKKKREEILFIMTAAQYVVFLGPEVHDERFKAFTMLPES
jgi:hypothetical protein